jgi:hypothetical protein
MHKSAQHNNLPNIAWFDHKVETYPYFEQNLPGSVTLEQDGASLNILVSTNKHKWCAMPPQKFNLA